MEGDHPALSLFNPVEPNSLQNQEEEENIEDIRQRQEEIQHFLTAVLDEYNYDESSCDETQKSSLHVYTENNNQLQALYEMRCKEVRELLEERDTLKRQLEEEHNVNENRRILSENLLEQCQVSMKQLQEALVAKTEKIGDYEKLVYELKNQCQEKVNKITELSNENEILRNDRDTLNEKLNEKEFECVSTNKVSEREIQNQYLEQISLLQDKLKEYDQTMTKLESANFELKNKVQKAVREKGDIIQEKDKTIRDLKYALDELKSQNAFLLEEFQKTKSEFLEYVDETKAAKEAYEKIKEQIAPSRLQEIDSTVSNLKRLLEEKDNEILELSNMLHLTQSRTVKEAATATDISNRPVVSLQNFKKDLINTKDEFQKILKLYETNFCEAKQKITSLIQDLCDVITTRDKCLVDLRKTAINEIEKLRNENTILFSTLTNVNKNLKEAKNQANVLESRVKSIEFSKEHSISFRDEETNTEISGNFLEQEFEFRDKIAQEFQQKLKNIEERYENATQPKFNHNKLKEQIVELAAKLHKYKSLYEESKKGMTEFLITSNEHIKKLETKVLAVEEGRLQTQKEIDFLKMLVEDKDAKLREANLILKQENNKIELLKKMAILEKFKNVASLNKKLDDITKSADILVKEVESEFHKRIKSITEKDS